MKSKAISRILLILALLVNLGISGTTARAGDPPPGAEIVVPPSYGEEGRWKAGVEQAETAMPTSYSLEIGVEYVHNYGGTGNLPSSDDTARELYDMLGRGGWIRRFIYGNRWAWEEDYKRASKGGTEYRYLDSVDLAFFHGHGGGAWDWTFWRWLDGPVYGVGGRNHDDAHLVPGDAYRSWGDGDAEWVAMKGCQILSDRSRRYWASAMKGLHLILGFKTNSYSTPGGWYGWWLGRYIRGRYTIPQAWFKATDRTQPHRRVTARVLADDQCHFRDRWDHLGCGDSPDWWYWWWDHTAGSERALMVDPADLNYEMPVFNVIAAAPVEEDLDQLASAFGFSPGVPAVLDEEAPLYRITEGPLDLTVDLQGMYDFINLDQLWSVPTDTTSLALQPLAPQDAREIADTFLNTNNLMPADAEFYEVVTDTMTSAEITEVPSTTVSVLGVTDTITDVQETISSTIATDQQVIYSRHIVYTPSGGDPITFSVQGPGARLKVYVSNDGQVIGAMGGWRAVDDVGVLDTVQIITPTQMATLYDQLGDMLNLAPTPFLADVVTVTRSTVGYYEQPMSVDQSSLTPVYILDLHMTDTESGDSLESTAFVPAAAGMLPPLAAITSITEEAPEVTPGQTLTLTAADASQPLSALGYGDNLDFPLGQGPYTYTWKLETTGRVIGTGRSITYPAGIVDDLGVDKDNDVPMAIVLEVTDATGHVSRVAQPFYFVGATPPVRRAYLPTNLRNP